MCCVLLNGNQESCIMSQTHIYFAPLLPPFLAQNSQLVSLFVCLVAVRECIKLSKLFSFSSSLKAKTLLGAVLSRYKQEFLLIGSEIIEICCTSGKQINEKEFQCEKETESEVKVSLIIGPIELLKNSQFTTIICFFCLNARTKFLLHLREMSPS